MTAPDRVATFAGEVGADGPVTCVGGRTSPSIGGEVDGNAREVRAPRGVVGHEPAEMTVRVRAGTPVVDLQSELASAGQRVLLPAIGPTSTVGGVLAVGRSDVRRLAHGPVRDVLLEARYVSSGGSVIKAGGPTVKNVSGFDLCRILVGSLGTLGFLGEVVLRTLPLPEVSEWFCSPPDSADPFVLVHELYRPAALLWDGHVVWVLLEGRAVDVRDQSSFLRRRNGFISAESPPDLPPLTASTSASGLRSAMQQLPALPGGSVLAEIGVGTIHHHGAPGLMGSSPPPERVVELNRRVKHEFDPDGRLNPGRAVVGAP